MTNEIVRKEFAGSMCGVEGIFYNVVAPTENKAKIYKQTFKANRFSPSGNTKTTVTVRFDDELGNGHNSFAITGDMVEKDGWGRWQYVAGGCIHDEIVKRFPELAHLIKWHLCSTDGPMHYVANTLYHASDRDAWGLRKGEKRQIINGKTKLPAWKLEATDGTPLHGLKQYYDGETPPAVAPVLHWAPWCHEGEGKERQLDFARNSAVWPEATDAELCAEPATLKAALLARLPGLIAAMRADIEAAGLLWEQP